MTGEQIVKILNARSTNPGARFQEVLNSVFQQVVKDNQLSFGLSPTIGNVRFDFWLPKGIGDYRKQMFVATKYYKVKNISKVLQDITKFFTVGRNYLFDESPKTEPLQYIVYVVNVKLTVKERARVIDKFKGLINRYEILIWDISDLNPYLKSYVEYIIDVVPELKEIGVQSIIEKSYNDEETEKKQSGQKYYREELAKSFVKEDIVLFLGAGVSLDAGLPSWDKLLSLLLLALIEKQLPEKVNLKLNNDEKAKVASSLMKLNGSSPLQSARYISSGLNTNFEKQVSDILYKDVDDLSQISILQAIVSICTPPRKGVGIKAIVNYNFDDIIEAVLDRSGIKNRPIYNDQNFPSSEEIGIFHVHGFLPRNRSEFEGIDSSLLVFSEENYHAVMSEPYNWSNLTQLNFFRENTCLFIGQSGTDPNLRRLLELAKKKTKISKHFIILRRAPKSKFIEEFDENNQPAAKAIETIMNVHHNLVEVSFDDIGLNVIWVDEFEEIPDLINSIRK